MKKIIVPFVLFGLSLVLVYGQSTTDETSTSKDRASLVIQDDDAGQEKNSQSATLETTDRSVRNLRLSGFTRLVGLYRDMQTYYDIDPIRGLTLPVNIGIGDGSGNPMLMLRMEANPSARTSILVETALHNNFGASSSGVYATGQTNPPDGRLASVFARFALEGKTVTDYGTFKLTAGGGMNWGKISPFTMWTFQYRDDMFERYPWDPAGSNWNRYNSYYSYGDIPRDLRWGNRSTQGIRIDGEDLPFGFAGTFMYGKTSTTGGFEAWTNGLPQNMVAARLSKKVGPMEIGGNYYNHFGYDTTVARIDSFYVVQNDTFVVNTNKTSQLIATLDAKIKVGNKIRIYTEVGAGSYLSGDYYGEDTIRNPQKGKVNQLQRTWSPMLYAEAEFTKAAFGLPVKVSAYAVGRNAINNSSAILNSSIENATDGRSFTSIGASGNNVFFFEGMVTEIGQITNNRAGGTATAKKKFGKLTTELRMGWQQELENLGIPDTLPNGAVLNGERLGQVRNSVTFYHIVNQYQRSRFDYINRFVGPYSRLQADFRRHWENIAITDPISEIDYKKSFSMLDLQLKYKTTFLKRDLILTAFGRANSVQPNVAPIPKFGEAAFVRQWYEEFMFFYQLNPKWTILGFFAAEQVKGNDRTELADANGDILFNADGELARQGETWQVEDPVNPGNFVTVTAEGSPIDQFGYGVGVGFDYDFAANACLDVRYRYISHKDRNFVRDEFAGHDLTAEFKIFF